MDYSLKDLIEKGKKNGSLTLDEVKAYLPDTIVDQEQIDDIIQMVVDMGIDVIGSSKTNKNKLEGNYLSCSFCGLSKSDVKHLIAGPNVYICDACVERCVEIISEKNLKDE